MTAILTGAMQVTVFIIEIHIPSLNCHLSLATASRVSLRLQIACVNLYMLEWGKEKRRSRLGSREGSDPRVSE